MLDCYHCKKEEEEEKNIITNGFPCRYFVSLISVQIFLLFLLNLMKNTQKIDIGTFISVLGPSKCTAFFFKLNVITHVILKSCVDSIFCCCCYIIQIIAHETCLTSHIVHVALKSSFIHTHTHNSGKLFIGQQTLVDEPS